MYNNIAIEQLALSIKNAFAEALPATLPTETRDSIIESYAALSNSLALAIKAFVLNGQTYVGIDNGSLKNALNRFMSGTSTLQVKSMAGEVIGEAVLNKNNILELLVGQGEPAQVVRGGIQ